MYNRAMSHAEEISDLSEQDLQKLQAHLCQHMGRELRHVRRQSLFASGLQAIAMVGMAVILFKASRQYFDLTLWGVGVCLLVFASLQFLDIEFIASGRSWMDIFEREEIS